MPKKTSVLLPLVLLALVCTSPSWACSASCGGNTCNGSGDCHCDPINTGSGTVLVPHCTDASAVATEEYVNYLRTWSLPGLNRMADAAEEMMRATEANDRSAYQRALDKHNRAEAGLSKAERQIYRGYERQTMEPARQEK